MSNKEEIINKLSKIENDMIEKNKKEVIDEERKKLKESFVRHRKQNEKLKLRRIENEDKKKLEIELLKIKELEIEMKKIEDEKRAPDMYKHCYDILTSDNFDFKLFKQNFDIAMSMKNMINESFESKNGKSIIFLHESINYSRNEVSKYLISNGANINLVNPEGYTPLMLCAINNNSNLFCYIINPIENFFETYISTRRFSRDYNLYKYAEKVNLKIEKDGKSAIDFASENLNIYMIRMIHVLLYQNIECYQEYNGRFLYIFLENMYSKKNNSDTFNLLVKYLSDDASVSYLCQYIYRYLLHPKMGDDNPIIKLLVKNNAYKTLNNIMFQLNNQTEEIYYFEKLVEEAEKD